MEKYDNLEEIINKVEWTPEMIEEYIRVKELIKNEEETYISF